MRAPCHGFEQLPQHMVHRERGCRWYLVGSEVLPFPVVGSQCSAWSLLFLDALWIGALISWPFVVGPPTFLSAILHKCRHFIAYILSHSIPKPLRNTFCPHSDGASTVAATGAPVERVYVKETLLCGKTNKRHAVPSKLEEVVPRTTKIAVNSTTPNVILNKRYFFFLHQASAE